MAEEVEVEDGHGHGHRTQTLPLLVCMGVSTSPAKARLHETVSELLDVIGKLLVVAPLVGLGGHHELCAYTAAIGKLHLGGSLGRLQMETRARRIQVVKGAWRDLQPWEVGVPPKQPARTIHVRSLPRRDVSSLRSPRRSPWPSLSPTKQSRQPSAVFLVRSMHSPR